MDRELELKDKMETTRYIQRLAKPTKFINPFSFGGGYKNGGLSDEAMEILKDIYSFEYMGSAEFEFGRLAQAFYFLSKQAQKDNFVSGKTKDVFYFCPKNYEEEVKLFIATLRKTKNEYKLSFKESCRINQYFDKKIDEKSKTAVGWIELNNGFMFFVDEEMFNKMKEIFGL